MAVQYIYYTSGTMVEYTDGVDVFRDGSLGGSYIVEVLDGASWDDLESIDAEGAIGIDTFRDGVRGGAYVIDKTLTPIGFAGIESLDDGITGDWINLRISDI
jgi:hypothetical protein